MEKNCSGDVVKEIKEVKSLEFEEMEEESKLTLGGTGLSLICC